MGTLAQQLAASLPDISRNDVWERVLLRRRPPVPALLNELFAIDRHLPLRRNMVTVRTSDGGRVTRRVIVGKLRPKDPAAPQLLFDIASGPRIVVETHLPDSYRPRPALPDVKAQPVVTTDPDCAGANRLYMQLAANWPPERPRALPSSAEELGKEFADEFALLVVAAADRDRDGQVPTVAGAPKLVHLARQIVTRRDQARAEERAWDDQQQEMAQLLLAAARLLATRPGTAVKYPMELENLSSLGPGRRVTFHVWPVFVARRPGSVGHDVVLLDVHGQVHTGRIYPPQRAHGLSVASLRSLDRSERHPERALPYRHQHPDWRTTAMSRLAEHLDEAGFTSADLTARLP